MRIVSLVPSITKTLCDIGLESSIVGCTQFCIDPPHLHRQVALVGGTKDPDLEMIKSLYPTHILMNREENRLEDYELLCQLAPTMVSHPNSPYEVGSFLKDLGDFLDCQKQCAQMACVVAERVEAMGRKRIDQGSFLYFIWQKPYMVAGLDTYISKCLDLVGLDNFAPEGKSYPSLSIQDICDIQPEYIFFGSEPYPFRYRDFLTFTAQTTYTQAYRLDGKLLSWHGSLTIAALDALKMFSLPCTDQGDFAKFWCLEKGYG